MAILAESPPFSRRFRVVTGRGTGEVVIGVLIATTVFRGPTEHHTPSFRYGQTIMRNKIYGARGTDDVTGSCEDAIDRATDHPQPFDRDEAVAGCKYLEDVLDN
jgi:hypothetical protein